MRRPNVIGKVLHSAVANAAHNDSQNPDELYVSACYADEGTTAKRWRPRARGRATRIRKRTCHITIIVSRLPEAQLELRRKRMEAVSATGPAGWTPRGAGPTSPGASRAAGPPRLWPRPRPPPASRGGGEQTGADERGPGGGRR